MTALGLRRILDDWRKDPCFVPLIIAGDAPVSGPYVSGAVAAPTGFLEGAAVVSRDAVFVSDVRSVSSTQSSVWTGRFVFAFSCLSSKEYLLEAADALQVAEGDDAQPTLDRMSSVVGDALALLGLAAPPPIVTTIMFNPPGVAGTSYVPDTGFRVGLHVDDHESLSALSRDDATPVCCINVGRDVRTFAYVPLTVAGLITRFKLPPTRETVSNLAGIVRRLEPDFPVFQVRIPPGCGYLATAQNLIHDGLPPEAGSVDRALLMLRSVVI